MPVTHKLLFLPHLLVLIYNIHHNALTHVKCNACEITDYITEPQFSFVQKQVTS